MEICHPRGNRRVFTPSSLLPLFNNYAASVLRLFMDAVERYGLPSHVRCDRGSENFDVGHCMLMHPLRGVGRSSIIAGRSVHNQRIER